VILAVDTRNARLETSPLLGVAYLGFLSGGVLRVGKTRRTAAKRAVYVNGLYYKTMSEAARWAAAAAGRKVEVWEIQRALNDGLQIAGVEIREGANVKEVSADVYIKTRSYGEPLLRYPLGEKPLDRGIRRWV